MLDLTKFQKWKWCQVGASSKRQYMSSLGFPFIWEEFLNLDVNEDWMEIESIRWHEYDYNNVSNLINDIVDEYDDSRLDMSQIRMLTFYRERECRNSLDYILTLMREIFPEQFYLSLIRYIVGTSPKDVSDRDWETSTS